MLWLEPQAIFWSRRYQVFSGTESATVHWQRVGIHSYHFHVTPGDRGKGNAVQFCPPNSSLMRSCRCVDVNSIGSNNIEAGDASEKVPWATENTFYCISFCSRDVDNSCGLTKENNNSVCEKVLWKSRDPPTVANVRRDVDHISIITDSFVFPGLPGERTLYMHSWIKCLVLDSFHSRSVC